MEEEYQITKVEETPLSQGRTITELKEKMEKDKKNYEDGRSSELIGYAIAGATALAGLVASYITKSDYITLLSVHIPGIIALGSAGYGKYVVGEYAWKYEKSYNEYYEAIKEQVINENQDQTKGRSK